MIFKVDKNVKIRNVGRIVLAPLIGCVCIIAVCIACKSIDNLWIRIVVSMVVSGTAYVLIQILLKNELVADVTQSIKKKFGR